jgi:hypothetical protein
VGADVGRCVERAEPDTSTRVRTVRLALERPNGVRRWRPWVSSVRRRGECARDSVSVDGVGDTRGYCRRAVIEAHMYVRLDVVDAVAYVPDLGGVRVSYVAVQRCNSAALACSTASQRPASWCL